MESFIKLETWCLNPFSVVMSGLEFIYSLSCQVCSVAYPSAIIKQGFRPCNKGFTPPVTYGLNPSQCILVHMWTVYSFLHFDMLSCQFSVKHFKCKSVPDKTAKMACSVSRYRGHWTLLLTPVVIFLPLLWTGCTSGFPNRLSLLR